MSRRQGPLPGITAIVLGFATALLSTSGISAESLEEYWSGWEELREAESLELGIELLTEAIDRYPNEIGFHCWLNHSLRAVGRLERALEQISPVYDRFSTDECVVANYLASLLELGWRYYGNQRREQSFEFFEIAWNLDPNDEWVQNAYGSMLRDSGELDRAANLFQSSLAAFPDNSYIRDNLVFTLSMIGDRLRDEGSLDAAIETYESARELNPENEWIYLSIGYVFRLAGDPRRAISSFERVASLSPQNEFIGANLVNAYLELERLQFAEGSIETALDTIGEALDRFPDEAWLLSDLIEYSVTTDDVDVAAEALLRLADPDLVRVNGVSAKVQTGIVHQKLDRIVLKFAEDRRFDAGFALTESIERLHPRSYFVEHAKGRLLFFSGEVKAGVAKAYRAYDIFIGEHSEVADPVIVAFPMKGTFVVYGNSSTTAITHAGLHRYSFDFMGADEGGRLKRANLSELGVNRDYFGFGVPIVSPVDGVVELVVDHLPDVVPTDTPTVKDGNSISILDSNGNHYFFTHNRRGSAKVEVGDTVKKGAIIAELGNSGFSGVPHLHFAVYTPDWLVTLPVTFARYSIVGPNGESLVIVNGRPETGEVILVQ